MQIEGTLRNLHVVGVLVFVLYPCVRNKLRKRQSKSLEIYVNLSFSFCCLTGKRGVNSLKTCVIGEFSKQKLFFLGLPGYWLHLFVTKKLFLQFINTLL